MISARGTKLWWHLVNKHIKKTKIAGNQFSTITHNGIVLEDADVMASAFTEYFTEQAQVDDPNYLP